MRSKTGSVEDILDFDNAILATKAFSFRKIMRCVLLGIRLQAPSSNPMRARPSLPLSIPLHAVLELDSAPTEDVERTADRQVDPASAQSLDGVQVGDATCSAGVRDRDGAPLAEAPDQILVDAALEAFGVGGMDEELGAVGGKNG